MKSYISIHDASPQNLSNIEKNIFTLKNKFQISKICLLVIPGLDWNQKQINKLKLWQKNGIQIAAHGWKHTAQSKKTLYHKIHSVIISNNCAEHLSKNKQEILTIINDSYNWFISNGFQKPILYVPPAWALGKIKKDDVNRTKFTHFECTTGILHKQKYYFLPLLGFEEKTYLGSKIRQFFNYLNFFFAYFIGVIRIAIHPNDFNLQLKDDIEKYLYQSKELILLHELN